MARQIIKLSIVTKSHQKHKFLMSQIVKDKLLNMLKFQIVKVSSCQSDSVK